MIIISQNNEKGHLIYYNLNICQLQKGAFKRGFGNLSWNMGMAKHRGEKSSLRRISILRQSKIQMIFIINAKSEQNYPAAKDVSDYWRK